MTATNLVHISDTLGFFNWFPEASHPSGVLIACSDLDNRIGLAHHLEGLGYDVWTAADGPDALEVGRAHPVGIDILVCDAGLSGAPAPVLFGKLRERHQNLRCCVLASVTHRGHAADAAAMGAVIVDLNRDAADHGDEGVLPDGTHPGRGNWGPVTEWAE